MKLTMERGIRLLVVANLLLVGALAIALAANVFGNQVRGHPAQSTPGPSATTELFPMGLAHIPTSSSCLLCHEEGGQAGLKPIPAVGHDIAGWERCTICHTEDRLGQTAPGHDNIPETECLSCHKAAPEGPSITQPHLKIQDQHCLDCHGNFAHLPTSMVGRNQDECWLCHKPTELPPPEYPHPAGVPLSCRSCHVSSEAGSLPIDHALRADNTCLLCHDIKTAQNPPTTLPSSPPIATPRPTQTPAP